MLLIIPAIEIKDGKCGRIVHAAGGMATNDDPIEMARLWRKENAKSLHVTDLDGLPEGRIVNEEVLRRLVSSVDIPIELGGALRSVAEVRRAVDIGCYRVTIDARMLEGNGGGAECVTLFGASKIVLGIVIPASSKEDAERMAKEYAVAAREAGIKRIIYTDILHDGSARHPNFDVIKELAMSSGLRVTVSGGIDGLEDLLKLQELEQFGVDSVVIGRALYENRFACQSIWRMCEADDYPYTAKV